MEVTGSVSRVNRTLGDGAASAFTSTNFIDLAGLINIQPGNQIAIGATSALTSATWDVTLVWEEITI